jgi:hypothetical protein
VTRETINVSCGFDDNGLPIGPQFIGKPWNDSVVLSLAHQFVAADSDTQSEPAIHDCRPMIRARTASLKIRIETAR